MTLGRYSMGTFMPGARIGQAHGTTAPADPETGARDALVFAMYHPAAALRSPAVERDSFEDIARVPGVLLRARERRAGPRPRPRRRRARRPRRRLAAPPRPPEPADPPAPPCSAAADPAADDAAQLTLF